MKMLTTTDAYDTVAAAACCPDVSISEAIDVIRLDAFKAGMSAARTLIWEELIRARRDEEIADPSIVDALIQGHINILTRLPK